MVLLPRIHVDILHYWFSYDAAISVVLVCAGASVLLIEYIQVLCMYDEKESLYSESPAIVLTEDSEALCLMLFDRELIVKYACAFL